MRELVGAHLTLVFPVPGTEGPVQGGHWKDSQMCVSRKFEIPGRV